MTNRLATLKDILARVEKATGLDTSIDVDVWKATAPEWNGEYMTFPAYTASLDACVALAERVLPGMFWRIGFDPDYEQYGERGPYLARLQSPRFSWAPTAPLRGHATYSDGYWRITDAGRAALAGNATDRPRSVTIPLTPTEEDVEAMARAMKSAEFGYSLDLTRLVDGVSTYTLDYSDGSDPLEFESADDAREHIASKRKGTQARAAFTALVARYSGGQG